MEVLVVDHGRRPSFDSFFKEFTNAKLLDNQGGEEITSAKEENKKIDADNERRGAEDEVEGEDEVYGIVSTLPMDLLISISWSFSSTDYRNFRAVCRRWRSLAPPLRWIPDSKAIRYPWLASFQIEDGIFNFYDPTSNFTYEMNTEASNPEILSSCGGWLLLAEGERSIYMLEPFRKLTVDLPLVPLHFNNLMGHVFAVDKTSTCYHFTRIYRNCDSSEKLKFLEFSSERGKWTHCSINDESFQASQNNLVIFRGSTFCLDHFGKLGSVQTVGNRRGWVVLNQSQKLIFPSKVRQNFLVSFKDELMSVFEGYFGGWVHVQKFNFSKREWEQVDSLGNLVLFVGRTSIAVEAEEERLRNKIFFPVFKKADGNIIFYSLDSGRFHSFSSKNSYVNFHGTEDFKILSNSTWIQPGLIPTFR